MYFKPFDYDDNNQVYLGSARNPHTKKPYDFWWINNESVTAKHGDEDHNYGSFCLYDTHINFDGEYAQKDYIWGMHQALIVCLWYLAKDTTPLIPNPNKQFLYDLELYNYQEPQ